MSDPVALTEDGYEKVARAVQYVASMYGQSGPPASGEAPSVECVFVKITGGISGSYYPCTVYLPGAAGTLAAYEPGKAITYNGDTLTTNRYYLARPAGQTGTDWVYSVEGNPDQVWLSVDALDGVTWLRSGAYIVFYNPGTGDGPGGGNSVYVKVQEASAVQGGVVTTGSQSFAGIKTFTDRIVVQGDPPLELHGDAVDATITIAIGDGALGSGADLGISPTALSLQQSGYEVFSISADMSDEVSIALKGHAGATGSGNSVTVYGGIVTAVSTTSTSTLSAAGWMGF